MPCCRSMSLYHNPSLHLVNLDVGSTVVPTVKHVHRYAQRGRWKGEGEEVHRRGGFWKKEGGGGRDSSALSPSGDSSVLGMSEGTTEEVFRYVRTTLHRLAARQPLCMYYLPTVCTIQWSLSKRTFRIGDTYLMKAISTTYIRRAVYKSTSELGIPL